MNPFARIACPTELNLLVAFFDLTQFASFSRTVSDRELFEFLADYYDFVGACVQQSGGTIVKFMGDAGLAVWPEAMVDRGVLGLRDLKESGDHWLDRRSLHCRHVIKADFGPVVCGPIGSRNDRRFDVFGQTVHTAALLVSNGLAITPAVFGKLQRETRKAFKRRTPPVTYVPVEERRRG
jgi:adenylate cyclase